MWIRAVLRALLGEEVEDVEAVEVDLKLGRRRVRGDGGDADERLAAGRVDLEVFARGRGELGARAAHVHEGVLWRIAGYNRLQRERRREDGLLALVGTFAPAVRATPSNCALPPSFACRSDFSLANARPTCRRTPRRARFWRRARQKKPEKHSKLSRARVDR